VKYGFFWFYPEMVLSQAVLQVFSDFLGFFVVLRVFVMLIEGGLVRGEVLVQSEMSSIGIGTSWVGIKSVESRLFEEGMFKVDAEVFGEFPIVDFGT
jgi:hypothetical protein